MLTCSLFFLFVTLIFFFCFVLFIRASPPTNSNNYTIRTSDHPSTYIDPVSGSPISAFDPVYYVPNQIVEIHIRALSLKARYLGILIYAINGTDNHTHQDLPVGTWTVQMHQQFFQVTPTCGGIAVTHKNANLKPLHTVFLWNAPPAGTGNVTFRLMMSGQKTHTSTRTHERTILRA